MKRIPYILTCVFAAMVLAGCSASAEESNVIGLNEDGAPAVRIENETGKDIESFALKRGDEPDYAAVLQQSAPLEDGGSATLYGPAGTTAALDLQFMTTDGAFYQLKELKLEDMQDVVLKLSGNGTTCYAEYTDAASGKPASILESEQMAKQKTGDAKVANSQVKAAKKKAKAAEKARKKAEKERDRAEKERAEAVKEQKRLEQEAQDAAAAVAAAAGAGADVSKNSTAKSSSKAKSTSSSSSSSKKSSSSSSKKKSSSSSSSKKSSKSSSSSGKSTSSGSSGSSGSSSSGDDEEDNRCIEL